MPPKFTHGDLVTEKLSIEKEFHITDWEQVNDTGFGDVSNWGIPSLTLFNGYLYAFTGKSGGGSAEIWRTLVGEQQSDWAQVNSDGFGDANNLYIMTSLEYNGYLYCAAFNSSTGGEIWRTKKGSQQSDWEQVNTDGFGDSNSDTAIQFTIFGGLLYAVVHNGTSGIEVWRTAIGSQQSDWEQVNTNGFGNSNARGAAPANPMIVFNGYLYVSAYSNIVDYGGEIWRSQDGENWSEVCDNGFGDVKNRGVQQFGIFHGYLYAIAANHTTGIEVWRTLVGSQQSDWEQVSTDGFGDQYSIDGFGLHVYNDYLYLGITKDSGNVDSLTEMWRSVDGVTWTMANVVGFGEDPLRNHEVWGFVNWKGYLYIGTTSNGSYGCRVYRLNTGKMHNTVGSIAAQGMSIPPIQIEHGNIKGVQNFIASDISSNTIGATGSITAKNVNLVIMTTAQKEALPSHAGQIVFDSDLDELCVETSIGWETLNFITHGEFYWDNNGNPTVVETADIPIMIRETTVGLLNGFTYNVGSTGGIAAFEDGTGKVNVASGSHGLETGDIISIRGTVNYNGVWEITRIDENYFSIPDTWVANDGGSDWDQGSYLEVGAAAAGKYTLAFTISVLNGGVGNEWHFIAYVNTTACPKCVAHTVLVNNDLSTISGHSLVSLSAGDRVSITVEEDSTNDITVAHGDLSLYRL